MSKMKLKLNVIKVDVDLNTFQYIDIVECDYM
jgi:hypothetical protein